MKKLVILLAVLYCLTLSITRCDDLIHPFSIALPAGSGPDCYYENLTSKIEVTFLYEVAAGEDFFIRATIIGPPPNNKIIYDESKLEEAAYTFTVEDPGEHEFCFDNSQMTYSDRDVNFNVALKIPNGVVAPEDPLYSLKNPSQTAIQNSNTTANITAGPPSALEAAISVLTAKVYLTAKLVDYYGLRIHRHMYLAEKLQHTVDYYGLAKSVAVLIWAALCVYAVKTVSVVLAMYIV
ncbi:hypothetical protein SeMB42_g05405 [Synchytrium endobioticum]|uniref:GOLD domain-containing protein n=1 Tax=Synchytrium endobioticum TaxID=286115 RepID=A0A507CRM7_9FUNG|nr:hypothetical protein SeMB42_g05405 [Synchytrium endobioticum]TPX44950.1 hypothetical protein SeLEV6574_g04184 [Synchytrium endobioticum]